MRLKQRIIIATLSDVEEMLTCVNDTYYFDTDGSMMINATMPDGHKVGIDGKWAI